MKRSGRQKGVVSSHIETTKGFSSHIETTEGVCSHIETTEGVTLWLVEEDLPEKSSLQ